VLPKEKIVAAILSLVPQFLDTTLATAASS